MGYVFEKSYDVRYNEVGANGRLLLSRLLNYFDDCAVNQSYQLGVGVDFLNNSNVTWFLYEWDIEIEGLPFFGENVRVITEPLDFYRFYATRRFELRDKDDNLMAKAISLWIFLDFEKRLPKRIPVELAEKYGCYPDNKKLAPWEVKTPSKEDFVFEFVALPVNMDTNLHINQATYVDWVLSSIPLEFLKDSLPVRFKSIYKKEVKPYEEIKVISELFESTQSIHRIFSPTINSDLCNIEIEWRKCQV
ncbi:MAG: acyl-[acyl-carrier-protein] thioesterase [Brevinematia bacterium]